MDVDDNEYKEDDNDDDDGDGQLMKSLKINSISCQWCVLKSGCVCLGAK